MTVWKYILTIVLLVACSAAAVAQTTGTGDLAGLVTDGDGGRLPGVTVMAVMGLEQFTTVTGANGQFRFLGLPEGTYRLTFSLEGFETVLLTSKWVEGMV